jgi:hypothetical protein
MLIQLDDYRKARTAAKGAHREEEELLCANWNPAVGLVALSSFQRPQELSPRLPDDYAALEPGFMDRVYALASQI